MAIFRELPVLELPHHEASGKAGELKPLSPARAREVLQSKKPEWLRIRPPAGAEYTRLKGLLRERQLHTVCEEAHCPNVSECWASGTATFMVGSEVCTRACRFCAVQTARRPPALDPDEPAKIAESVALLGLHYVVLTMVDRDDMEDGGADHMARTIEEIKKRDASILVEALVSDFQGDVEAVKRVVDSGLDVYAHNIETVKRLQYRVRDPRAGYLQSLSTLRAAKNYARSKGQPLYTKSALMLGLGETSEELAEAYQDLRSFEVDVLTIGQYLRPSLNHLPVERFVTPEEFAEEGRTAESAGFLYVASGPMVRSSYRAGELFLEGKIRSEKVSNHRSPSVVPQTSAHPS